MTHETYVKTDRNGLWVAVCTCGWRGRPVFYVGRAENAAAKHAETAREAS